MTVEVVIKFETDNDAFQSDDRAFEIEYVINSTIEKMFPFVNGHPKNIRDVNGNIIGTCSYKDDGV